MPDCSTGAVTMKMTSRTRTTSTSGVMLISASEVRVWPELAVKATCGLPLHRILVGVQTDFFEAVEQFAGKVVHAGGKLAQRRSELVVGDNRWDGDEQAGCGRDEGLRDARGHSAQCSCPLCTEAVESIHDAHHGAEQAHERRYRADGGQPGKAALQHGKRFAGRSLGGALERSDVLGWSEAARLATVGVVDLIEDVHQGAGLE